MTHLVSALGVLLVFVAVAAWVFWTRAEEAEKYLGEARLHAAVLEDQLDANEAAASGLAVAETRIRTVTREVLREIPVRIPVDACPLPADFRVLHNAAAAGALPEPPGGPDGAASAPPAAASR
jgi:hypothetical protein